MYLVIDLEGTVQSVKASGLDDDILQDVADEALYVFRWNLGSSCFEQLTVEAAEPEEEDQDVEYDLLWSCV